MKTKIPSEITNLTLNDASYKGNGVSISPTLINFFFGNNGTGKSTVGKAIKSDKGVTWQSGKSRDDYTVLVYNQDFISANIQSYHNMHGVFTVNETNITIQKQVEEKTAEREKASIAFKEATEAEIKKKKALDEAHEAFQQKCWDKTVAIRKSFEKTQEKRKTKKAFAEAVLGVKTPKEYDVAMLSRLYATAYSDDARRYTEFATIATPSVLDTLPGRAILGEKIVSSSDTSFAQFIKAINATTWVQQGYEHYHSISNGKCPYCQQMLPDTFEQDIRSCFDAQYQSAVQTIMDYHTEYRKNANEMFKPLMNPPSDLLPEIDITPYNDKLEAIKGVISANVQKIADKIAEPSKIVDITDVAAMLQGLSAVIENNNRLIQENNEIVEAKPKKQAECKSAVWEHIAFLLADEVGQYLSSIDSLEKELTDLASEIIEQKKTIALLSSEIAELNKNYVNTTATIESVNTLLRDSGFQGFFLREKQGVSNVYEVVRPDETVAENLSEGERNFIAFLYFYHLVKGSETADGGQYDKVVVIDDPVSSMDSNSLFIISALVRDMIEICENNAISGNPITTDNYIKQLFILTHNAYFHREITYNQVKNYQYVNFYLISKVDNKSFVRCCVKKNPDILTEEINYNPVQNSYAALWEEYKVINASIPLMNVIRRILEHYFLQLCGYDGITLRKRILTDNKNKFITTDANGNEDYTQYQMAYAMLSYINANSVGINDGINFVDDCVDVEQTKETFHRIFTLMEQGQHYDMMMGNQ